jgi:diguanylate cyclase (GGDEF)-like protein
MLFDPSFVRSNLGILVFDVDHFKKVNDQFGHDTGDRVLSTIAQVIGNNVRQTDVLGRWGGEEFILICPQITLEQVKGLAEKLRLAIEEQEFNTPNGALKVTISIGAAIVDPQETFEAAFKRADTALYKAKNSGRNQTQLA